MITLVLGGAEMYRALGAAALLAIAIATPVQDAAAQDPLGGAILGGAAGAILGGAMGGGRGAAIGAIVGGANGGQAATVTTSRLAISSVETVRGSWLRLSIARRLRNRSRLLRRRHVE